MVLLYDFSSGCLRGMLMLLKSDHRARGAFEVACFKGGGVLINDGD